MELFKRKYMIIIFVGTLETVCNREVSVLERRPNQEVHLYIMGMLIKSYVMYLGVGQNNDPQSMDYPYGLRR